MRFFICLALLFSIFGCSDNSVYSSQLDEQIKTLNKEILIRTYMRSYEQLQFETSPAHAKIKEIETRLKITNDPTEKRLILNYIGKFNQDIRKHSNNVIDIQSEITDLKRRKASLLRRHSQPHEKCLVHNHPITQVEVTVVKGLPSANTSAFPNCKIPYYSGCVNVFRGVETIQSFECTKCSELAAAWRKENK